MRDPAQVAVAVALGAREQAGVPAAEAVARVLGRRQLLLVLDNCEHMIGAVAELCGGLLQACDDVRVLATRSMTGKSVQVGPSDRRRSGSA